MFLRLSHFLIFFICQYHVKAEIENPLLLLVNQADIQLIPVNDPNNTQIVTRTLKHTGSCDFVYERQLIYWIDAKDYGKSKIQCMNMSDPIRKIVDVVSSGIEQPDGLTCDWIGNKIYWTDADKNRIEVSEFDGTSRKVLIWSRLDQPRAIVVDPAHAYVYWTDWGEVPKIERAGMDGTRRQVLVNDNIYWPNGITIDYENGKVYWVEANYHFIHRMDLDGSHREEVISSERIRDERLPLNNPIFPLATTPPSTNLPAPFRLQESKKSEKDLKLSGALQHPFAITVQDEWIYWTDWATESIHSMLKNGTGLPVVVKEHDISPMDLKVYSQQRQKSGRNPCGPNNGGCSHLCLLSPDPPNYRCACPTGVKIMSDNKTCKSGPSEILLLARRADLRVISLDTEDYSDVLIPVDDVMHAVAIEFDPVEKYVYWTDDKQKAILRVHLNGSGSEAIVSDNVEQSDGIAIDWIARNLYWTDTGRDCITVSRLNGTSEKVLIDTEIEEPRAIVLDPVAGHLYWSDWGDNAKIERANLDGSDRLIFVDTDVDWPNGLALDYDNSLLFWADAGNDRIEVIYLNGTGRKILLSNEIPHIFGLSLLGNYLYWTDWQRRRIEKMKVGHRGSRRVLVDQLPDIFGVKATSMTVRPGKNPCAFNNGGCSHLCLYTPEGEKCHCPTGLELSPSMRDCILPEAFLLFSFTKTGGIRRISLDTARGDACIPFSRRVDASFLDFSAEDSRIYWTNTKDMTILRSFMNGSNIESFIDVGIEMLEGLAVDWIGRNVYWADSSANRIEVAHMDRTSRRSIIWKGIDSPRCLALDPIHGFIYWSEWGSEPCIRRAEMDGSNVVQINKGKTGRANSLTIDYEEQRLYWVDFDINVIVSSDMNGNDVLEIVVGGATKTISSLALYGEYVYWSDSKLQAIERANKITGSNEHVIESGLKDIDDIMVYHSSRQSGATSCSRHNGGCQHLCFSLPGGSHTCSCPAHYYLNSDNATCTEPLNFLLLSQTHHITRVIFKLPRSNVAVVPSGGRSRSRKKRARPSPDAVLPISGIQDACSIDYDPIGKKVYWLDCKAGELKSARPNGTEISVLLRNNGTNQHPFDIALDYYSGFLYWTDSTSNSIKVMRLDGRPVGTVLSGYVRNLGGKSIEILPRKIVVDSMRGRIYFTNPCRSVNSCRFKIMQAAVDGSDCNVFFNHGLRNVTALVVDQDEQRLYWADQTRIEWSHLDGSGRSTLVNSGLNRPVGLALFGEQLYWVDARTDGGLVEGANKFDGSGRKKIQSRIRNLRDMVSVISMNESVLVTHPCSMDNGGCSHICVVKEDGTTRCSCPNHLTLVEGDHSDCGEPSTCSALQFTCKKRQQCIPLLWRCDGEADCLDDTDEHDCYTSKECEGKFLCGSLSASSPDAELLDSLKEAQCIDYQLVCDGRVNCLNGEDEVNCSPCPPGEIHCSNDQCVPAASACKDCQGICPPSPSVGPEHDNKLPVIIGIACGCVIVIGIGLFLRHCMLHGNNNQYPPGTVMFTPNSDGHLNLNVEFQPHNNTNPTRTTLPGGSKKPYFNFSIVPPASANGTASHGGTSRNGWPVYRDGLLAERPRIPGASSTSSGKRQPSDLYSTPDDTCGPDYFCSSDSQSVQNSSYYRCKNGHRHRRHVKSLPIHGAPPPTPCTTDTCEDFEGKSFRPNNPGAFPPDPPPPYYHHHSCCHHCYHQHNGHRFTSSSGSGSSRRGARDSLEPPCCDRPRSGRRRHYNRPYAPPPTPRSQYMSECCDTTEVEDTPEVEEITNQINELAKEDDEETVLLTQPNRTSPSITERSYCTLLYNPPPSPVTDSS